MSSSVHKTVRTIEDTVAQMKSRQDTDEDRKILGWLTPFNHVNQHNDFFRRRLLGTGQWLLESAEFQEWLKTDKQTLFCPGIPGAGKTTITAIVIDYLQSKFRNDQSTGIAYIYCDFRRQDEQSAIQLLSSLVKQLAQGLASFPATVKKLYEHLKNSRRPTMEEISAVLHSVAANYAKVFIVVDALDECQSGGVRTRLLREAFNLQTKTDTNIFATSRNNPEINKRFEGGITLKVRATDEDVERYLEDKVLALPPFVSNNPELCREIKTKIVERVDGMYVPYSFSETNCVTNIPLGFCLHNFI